MAAQILDGRGSEPGLIGLVLSTSWISVFVFGPFMPVMIRTLGGRQVNFLAALVALTSLGILLAAQSIAAIVASSVLMGLSLIMRWIVCDTLVVTLSSDEKRGRMIGLHEALMGMGIAVGPLLFTALNLDQVIWASLAICLVAMALLGAVGSAKSAANVADEDAPLAGMHILGMIRQSPAVLLALGAAFVGGFIESSSVALFPISFQTVGLSLPAAAVLVSSFGFGGTILQPPLGFAADRYGYPAVQAACVAVVAATSLIAVTAVISMPMLLVTLFLLGASAGGFNTLAVVQAGQTLTHRQIPLAMTSIAMLYTAGSVAGPIASGLSLERLPYSGIFWLYIAIAAVFAAGLVARYASARRQRV